jgi:hypothetical protein
MFLWEELEGFAKDSRYGGTRHPCIANFSRCDFTFAAKAGKCQTSPSDDSGGMKASPGKPRRPAAWCQRMRPGLDGFDGGFHKGPELR